jgi:hypothetical protein
VPAALLVLATPFAFSRAVKNNSKNAFCAVNYFAIYESIVEKKY